MVWDLPRPEQEPVTPELAGGFLMIVPPGKPHRLKHFVCFPSTSSGKFSSIPDNKSEAV